MEAGRRRLSVCARDVYRLVEVRGTAVAQIEYGLLERLLREQCHAQGRSSRSG